MKRALLFPLLAIVLIGGCDGDYVSPAQHRYQEYVKAHSCKLHKDMADSYLRSDGTVENMRWSAFECPGLDDYVDVDYVDGRPWRP